MYETVKVVNGYEITRMKGTHGFYEVTVKQGVNWRKVMTFRTIKAATEYIMNVLSK